MFEDTEKERQCRHPKGRSAGNRAMGNRDSNAGRGKGHTEGGGHIQGAPSRSQRPVASERAAGAVAKERRQRRPRPSRDARRAADPGFAPRSLGFAPTRSALRGPRWRTTLLRHFGRYPSARSPTPRPSVLCPQPEMGLCGAWLRDPRVQICGLRVYFWF